MPITAPIFFAALIVSLAGCSLSPPEEQEKAHPLAALVNRVWVVEESNAVATGTLYVLLEEGTLVISSSYSEPLLGQWRLEGERLILVEQGLDYAVDVISLDPERVRLRIHNPGVPVEMTLIAASAATVH